MWRGDNHMEGRERMGPLEFEILVATYANIRLPGIGVFLYA